MDSDLPKPSSAEIISAAKAARQELDVLISTLEATPDPSAITNKHHVMRKCREVTRAVQGPVEAYIDLCLTNTDFGSFSAAGCLGVFANTPGDGDGIAEEELAKIIGVNQDHLGRILKMNAVLGTLQELPGPRWKRTEIGNICAHPLMGSIVNAVGAYWSYATSKLGNFLKENPNPTKTGDSTLSWLEGKSVWELLGANPELAIQFGLSMEAMSTLDDSLPILQDWVRNCGRKDGKWKDVGGGTGHIDMRLAKEFPGISFEVQDANPHGFEERQKLVPDELRSQISYKLQSFFEPQTPEPNTIAYFMKWIIHDWMDEDAIRIIRGIVPALEKYPETVLLINDIVLPDLGEWETFDELNARRLDISVFTYLNGKERSRQQWKQLLETADSRLNIVSVKRQGPPGSMGMSLIEVRLQS